VTHSSPLPEPPAERDPLAERLDSFARREVLRSRAWSQLDTAIARDRRRRNARATLGGALAAVLALAVLLPFTPLRIGPLDQLAAALGLRAQVTSLPQDVFRDPDDYREVEGAPIGVDGGQPVTDDAWLDAVARRALPTLGPGLDDSGPRTVWAGDDGHSRRAVVAPAEPGQIFEPWAMLSGPSGASPEQMTVTWSFDAFPSDRLTPALDRDTTDGVVALYQPGSSSMSVATAPAVDGAGRVTLTWHDARRVADGVWLADVGERGVTRGITPRSRVDGLADGTRMVIVTGDVAASGRRAVIPGEPPAEEPGWGAAVESTLTRALQRFGGMTPQSAVGTGSAQRVIDFDPSGRSEGSGLQDWLVEVRALRAPEGGWVAGVFVGPAERPTGEAWLRMGDPLRLDSASTHAGVIALPALPSGQPPLAGFKVQAADDRADNYVVAWAPPRIVSVRSGDVSAPVVDGIAILDARAGGTRVHRGKPDQALLLEGLDAAGTVVARTRVNEPHIDVAEPGEDDETEGIRTHLPWPTIAWP
jgi:hypothetical protein